jgi:hypothetical protein
MRLTLFAEYAGRRVIPRRPCKLIFQNDAFVRFADALDSILKLTPQQWQLLYHCEDRVWFQRISRARFENHGFSDPIPMADGCGYHAAGLSASADARPDTGAVT